MSDQARSTNLLGAGAPRLSTLVDAMKQDLAGGRPAAGARSTSGGAALPSPADAAARGSLEGEPPRLAACAQPVVGAELRAALLAGLGPSSHAAGAPASSVVQFGVTLGRMPELDTPTLVAFARGQEALPAELQFGVLQSPDAQQRVLSHALLTRAGAETLTRASTQLSEVRAQLQELHRDREALVIFLGHAAANHASAGEIAEVLGGLGVSEGARNDAAASLVSLRQDMHKHARFMAGEDVGLGVVVDRVVDALPRALSRVDELRGELAGLHGKEHEVMLSGRFGAVRDRTLAEGELAEARPLIARAVRELRRDTLVVDVTVAGLEGEAFDLLGRLDEGAGKLSLGRTAMRALSDFQRVGRAGSYEALGLAQPRYQDAVVRDMLLDRAVDAVGVVSPAAGLALDAAVAPFDVR